MVGERIRRAQVEPADGADVLLELGGRRTFDRPVAAVMDAWGELIGDQALIRHEEELDGEGAGHAHHHGQPLADGEGPFGDLGVERRRREALDQDPLVMPVACERERRDPPDGAAGDDIDTSDAKASSVSTSSGSPGRRPRRSMAPSMSDGSFRRSWPRPS